MYGHTVTITLYTCHCAPHAGLCKGGKLLVCIGHLERVLLLSVNAVCVRVLSVCVFACVCVYACVCRQTRLTKLLAVKKDVVSEVKAMNAEAERMVSALSILHHAWHSYTQNRAIIHTEYNMVEHRLELLSLLFNQPSFS